MSNCIHFLNGSFVTEDKLLISPKDLGFVRGYAVADFLVTHNLKPFKLEEHVDRLFKSAEIIGLRIPWSTSQIIAWARETLAKNNPAIEKTLKIIISGGNSHSMHQANPPTIVMIVDGYKRPPQRYYDTGVKALAVHYKRQYPEAKHTHYVEAIRQLSNHTDVDEVIYYDESQVFEGAGCNVFAVIDNKLLTPKSNIVDGITRNVLLQILNLPIPIEIKDFSFADLQRAYEIFLTGSSKEIRGVVKINETIVGDGKVGAITKEAARQYRDYVYQTTKD